MIKKLVLLIMVFMSVVLTGSSYNQYAFEVQSFSRDFDGILLTVSLKSIDNVKGEIYIDATVQNNREEAVALWSPTVTKRVHGEIKVSIRKDGIKLFDIDAYMIFGAAMVNREIIKPGEEYTQEMRFSTFYYDEQEKKHPISVGIYQGTVIIQVIYDVSENMTHAMRTTHEMSFDFEIKEI